MQMLLHPHVKNTMMSKVDSQSPWSALNLGIKDVQHGISCAQGSDARLKVAEVVLDNIVRAKGFSNAYGGRP
ncbi:unnamed protein product [Penicillium roqueforti FM164]|uniref:Genomic scaffold, ProqFM164S01 n=1 Tax=Penicillium roqueforti (strain FM164) TaxID=1365484 RepID=W6PSD7_PENRF|nr:unnamed protein product [Penicillium roqueforti FM164]